MRFSINKLILWPKDSDKSIREIAFDSGKVNVITGDSRSGKSALTAIIDYVLGSGSCAIPVGPIRDKTAWFGLLLQTADFQILVARAEPGDRRSSASCSWHQGIAVPVPSVPTQNANQDEIKGRLSKLAGLSDLPLDDDPDRGFRLGRPSFRDLVALNFLPQYIVANPYALFYKADRPDHREKLRAVFPLILGVDEQESLVLRHEQRALMRELRPLEAEREQNRELKERWHGKAFGFWTEAQELSLLPPTADAPRSIEATVRDLRRLLAESKAEPRLPDPGTGERAVDRRENLKQRERALSTGIGDRKRRLGRLRSLAGAVSGYSEALSLQRERLGGLGWFEKHLAETASCPLCGSDQDSARKALVRLQALAVDLARETQALTESRPMVDKEQATLREELRDLEELHRQVRHARLQIERDSAEDPDQGVTLERVHNYLGRLEQALSDHGESQEDAALIEQINAKQARLDEIARRLDSGNRQERLRTALAKVSRQVTEHARLLELERAEEIIELDIQSLNLRFSDPDRSRKDMLSDLGSGENWMGYHLATFLALHELFAAQHHSPVPNFLVIDQPSQVYFPAEILDEHAGGERPELNDKDKRATRRIFEALAAGVERIGGGFQVIVTEHADEDIWGGISGVALTERWRGETDYLIPRAWLDPDEQDDNASNRA